MSFKIKPSFVLASALSLIAPIAFANASTERHSAAQKIYPQHQLKNEKLKSAHPKGKKSKSTNKESFASFEAKKIEIIFKDSLETRKELGLDKYINSRVDGAKLAEIKQLVQKYYEDQDFLMPQVRFDEKSSKKGILRLEVYPVRITNTVVLGEGEHNKLIKEYVSKITSQDVAHRSYTEKMLGLANKVPGIEVAYEIIPLLNSYNDGVVDAELVMLTKTKKASIFSGANNFAPNDVGKYQFSALGELYRPFADNDSLSIHGATTNYPDRLHDIGIGYGQVLNSYGTSANIMAAYARDDANAGSSSILPNSRSNLVRGSVIQQVLLSEHQDLEVEMSVKRFDSSQFKTDNGSTWQKSKVSQYTAGMLDTRYIFADILEGDNLISLSFTQGLSGKQEDYVDDDVLAKKHFNKYGASYVRDQQLVGNFTLYLKTTMSHSSHVLPDAEKSVIGGNVYGRGYAFATLQGTKMKAGAVELRYTKHEPHEYIREIQPYIFMDYSHVNISNPNTDISNLRSYGGGLRFRFIEKVDLGMEVAQPCKQKFMSDGESINAKTKFNIFINKVFEF